MFDSITKKMTSQKDNYWMEHALQLAEKAGAMGEVPIGAVLVCEDRVLGEGWNQPISTSDPTAHAEIIALRMAARALQNYRMPNTTLYTTLEPCPMCTGALVHARIGRLVFGAIDPKGGAVTSIFQLLDSPQLNHKIFWEGGHLADRCGVLLRQFFQARR